MSKANTDHVLQLLNATLRLHGGDDSKLFESSRDLYRTIDATKVGDVSWQTCTIKHDGPVANTSPSWMADEHEIWFRDPHEVVKNMLANPDFDGHFDCTPYTEKDSKGSRRWKDFMSGDWAWDQAVSVQVENT